MKTLVLCVDRDDDFGEKIGVNTPIVGRKNNFDAATSILLKDPEESDGNALFGAIKIHDEIVNRGEKAEIITICGGSRVNQTTDKKLFKELEMALYISKAKDVILVTDGSEDEYILPIIGSRIYIISKSKIVVKQSDRLESIYFYFTKVLEDEKTQRIVVPLALILIFGGITTLMGIGNIGYGSVAVLIGLYLIVKTFHLEHPLISFVTDVRKGFDARISFITSIIAFLLILAGLATFLDGMQQEKNDFEASEQEKWQAANLTGEEYTKEEWNILGTPFVVAFLKVVQNLVIWLIAAVIFWKFGRAVDTYFSDNSFPWQEGNKVFFYIAWGLIVNGSLDVIRAVVDDKTPQALELFSIILGGILFLLVWRGLHNYLEKRFTPQPTAKGWRK